MNDELSDLLYWAWARGQDAALEPPTRLHGQFPTAEDTRDRPLSLLAIGSRPNSPNRPKTAAIVGRPFTRDFEKYLDNAKPMTPIRKALFSMKPKDRPMPLAVRICWQIVEGGYSDPELLRTIMRMRWEVFERLALIGLRRLKYETEWLEKQAA